MGLIAPFFPTNEAIRTAVWMEISLGFNAPQGNEWGRANRWETQTRGFFAPQLIPFSPEASRSSSENWSEPRSHLRYRRTVRLHIARMSQHGKTGWSCEDNLAASGSRIVQRREPAGRRRGIQTRLSPLGSLPLLQGQPLKCLIKLNKSKQAHLRAS